MALLSIVQDVCETVGVERPTALFSVYGTDRTAQEMVTLANEAAQATAWDYRDWTELTEILTFQGDGAATSFKMPVTFRRMLVDGNVYTSVTPNTPLRFISSFDEWLRRVASGYWMFSGQYTFQGGNLLVQPAPPAGATISLAYISNNIINNVQNNTITDHFMSDVDTTVLDERLLKLAMIYRWKQNKGTAYAEDMGNYLDALMMRAGRNKPSPILISGVPMSNMIDATVAYPWPLPTP